MKKMVMYMLTAVLLITSGVISAACKGGNCCKGGTCRVVRK